MRAFFLNRWAILALRLVIGSVFLYSGWIKALGPEPFADSIVSFKIFPQWSVSPIALGLPIMEVAVGVMLITGLRLRLAAFSSVTLLGMFSVLLGSAMSRGIEIDCGCFGGNSTSAGTSLARDLLLLLAAAFIYRSALLAPETIDACGRGKSQSP